jgi:large subunit ribosomal protein L17
MLSKRKLGRRTALRKAMLRGLVSSLIQHGKVKTTENRAKEVKSIVDRLISMAVKEVDNFTVGEAKIYQAKVDDKGKKITKTVTSKNGRSYAVVEREETTKEVHIDSPSRLQARREAIKWLYRVCDKDGNRLNLADKLFDEIAPPYKRNEYSTNYTGGYTRIYKLGSRRGDAAEQVIIELAN